MEGVSAEGTIDDRARDEVMIELRRSFRPEFLNRVDDVVLFKPLTLDEIKQIVVLQADELRKRLHDRRIDLKITDTAREFIAQKGFDPVFGARPLKRFLQHELETRIGREIIRGEVLDGATITVDLKDGQLAIKRRNPKATEPEEEPEG
jgi:ATP-dependent Clp protease ATP-binding subunit ClpB